MASNDGLPTLAEEDDDEEEMDGDKIRRDAFKIRREALSTLRAVDIST